MINEELKLQIDKLNKELVTLKEFIHRDNFFNLKVYNQKVGFNRQINLKNLTANPVYGEVGDLACVNTKLVICTVASTTSATWVVVGTQS